MRGNLSDIKLVKRQSLGDNRGMGTLLLSPAAWFLGGLTTSFILSDTLRHHIRRFLPLLFAVVLMGLGGAMRPELMLTLDPLDLGVILIGLFTVFIAGTFFQRLFKIPLDLSFLLMAGTAICGGSAIAAVSAVMKPKPQYVAVAFSIVFMLNGVALLIFPALAVALGLSSKSIALWAAVAIHDTSSVIGSTLPFGESTVVMATFYKLIRASFIFPLVMVLSAIYHTRGSSKGLYVLAGSMFGFVLLAGLPLWIPGLGVFCFKVYKLTKFLMLVVMFCVGSTVSVADLKDVPKRVVAYAVLLWMMVGGATLFGILTVL